MSDLGREAYAESVRKDFAAERAAAEQRPPEQERAREIAQKWVERYADLDRPPWPESFLSLREEGVLVTAYQQSLERAEKAERAESSLKAMLASAAIARDAAQERERALREASTRAVRHIENARRAQRLTGYPDAQLRQALVELDEALTANPSEEEAK